MTRRTTGKSGKRPKLLDDEDQLLWEATTRTITPLGGKRRAADDASTLESIQPASKEARAIRADIAGAGVLSKARTLAAPPVSRAPAQPPAGSQTSAEHQALSLDRRKIRKLAKGHIEIEGKIDLHGLRQADAHRRLRAFLLKCHAEDRRLLLVVTGKGTSSGSASRGGTGWHGNDASEERGVLRRNVPRWLAEPELAAIVAGHSEAHVRHGGAGALYVRLRKRSG